ncbi:MAG: hypothetical protein WCO84_01415 [bacterium]
MKYKIWNGQDTLVTPIGEILTAEDVKAKYPASGIAGMKYVICDSPIALGVFMEFTQTKAMYRDMIINSAKTITTTEEEIATLKSQFDALDDQEVLDAITYFEEHPAPAQPTADDRIAAAMEVQNMLAMMSL